jgi:hypothetical protein
MALAIFLLAIIITSCRQPSENGETTATLPPQPPARYIVGGYKFRYPAAENVKRSDGELKTANATCVTCHSASDGDTMHNGKLNNSNATVVSISCVDCHGGNNDVSVPAGIKQGDPQFEHYKHLAHVQPTHPELWIAGSAANPQTSGAQTLKESVDYIRFVNPGDLRAAEASCGACHNTQDEGHIVDKVKKSMMATGPLLWEAALYNNGSINRKTALYGESYSPDGKPQKIQPTTRATVDQVANHGMAPALWPLPRWEVTQPGNILRVFERGGKSRPIVGEANSEEDPGHPDVKLSVRGYGTDVRTDPVWISLQKTRLLDPTLAFVGTNDHPGDYRASGCSACHVVYSNDNSPVHSGLWADAGHRGTSAQEDPQIPTEESGHPVKHMFVKDMPTSTCIVCHVHPGTNVLNSYLGFTWWDNETDGKLMYPQHQKYPTAEQEFLVSEHNPEGTAVRGLWSDLYPGDKNQAGMTAGPNFLENLTQNINPFLKHTQFADFHGHGWVFRAVYKQDRHGNMLDANGNVVTDVTNDKLKAAVDYQWKQPGDHPAADTPVHLKDVHLEMGMHCVDCHFDQDSHGDGNLYGETRAAVAIDCIDCHGTAEQSAAILRYKQMSSREQKSDAGKALFKTLFTGNAAPSLTAGKKNDLIDDQYFEVEDGKLYQKSRVRDPNDQSTIVRWEVKQTSADNLPRDKWNDNSPEVKTARAALFAHTVRKDGKTWGTVPAADEKRTEMQLAHSNSSMSCYACHSSWNTSCFGCHLPMRANQAKNMLHNEGQLTRNYTQYNYQTLRDDVYMLGKDSTSKNGKIVPVRSACAVMVGSTDALRQRLYEQQQTISAEGYAGTSFSPYFPHTVRTTETKHCTDCHISSKNDNNAIMAQLLLQGTNAVNFIGHFAWIACGKGGLNAVAVTEFDEPQAVIGSRLHELAFPDYYKQHLARGGELTESHEKEGTILDLQARGEYLYTACGEDGFIAYDIANIDNKGFSERIITAPVSPLGQQFYVKTKYATSVCSPSTLALDPTRKQLDENQEQKGIHLLYAFLYVTDKYEGLVIIGNPLSDNVNKPGVATLLDGDPTNNFLKKALSYNPGGALDGARSMTLYGHYAYICSASGLHVVDLNNPLQPELISTPNIEGLNHPKKIQFQFRYGFVIDDDGLKIIDVTDPERPHIVPNAAVPISDARDIYLSRTYGYVAAGHDGLDIIDLERPESPTLALQYNADGQMNDATAIKIGMTNSCLYAYVGDGHNGLKVLQLTSADERDDTPTYMGFSPMPKPRLIAHFHTHEPVIAISEGLDRDRAVDESGHQLSVFGRKGARPLNYDEQRSLYLRPDGNGNMLLWTVDDEPATAPLGEVKKETPVEAPPAETPGRRRRR